MKRLRRALGPVRFFACGEYGEKFNRPHYHACLFGLDFPDKRQHKTNKNGDILYTSKILEKIWSDPKTHSPLGHCLIGAVTMQSAAYVARYILKKINGPLATDHYQNVDSKTGEITTLNPEFVTMSRRPGIAKNWLEKFNYEPYPDDFIVDNKGHRSKVPRYYDQNYEIAFPSDYKKLKKRRILAAQNNPDNTPKRLAVRETVQNAKLNRLPRTYEDPDAS